ncbi:MAG: DUF4468 domain-containing protein [Prevotella sp.]|nr:DUF4468 domain-containing protein [Prevotella sp.]
MKKLFFTIMLFLPLTALAQSEWEAVPTQNKVEEARKAAEEAKAAAKAAKKAAKEAARAEKEARKQAAKAGNKTADAAQQAEGKQIAATKLVPARHALDPNSEDYKYLKPGAMPEQDGNVVFTLDLDVPALSAQQVYDRMYVALDTIANQECQIQDERSKNGVVLVNKKEHSIVAQYHEWMTFKKNFVVLDRTRFNYTVIAKCTDGHLHLTLERMTFLYEQGRPTEMRTSAEEWISDKEAINKKGTKLLPGSAKFRRSTIDRKDELFELITKMVKGNE